MGLSLEGFRGEFEVGKIAFELEDLKKDKEKRREKIGDFAFFLGRFRFEGKTYIYVREEGEKRSFFLFVGGFFFEKKHALGALEKEGGKTRSNEKRVIAAKDCPGMLLVTLNVPIPIRFLHLVVFSF